MAEWTKYDKVRDEIRRTDICDISVLLFRNTFADASQYVYYNDCEMLFQKAGNIRQEMSTNMLIYENIDSIEYHKFLKKIYSKCDAVWADFDAVITDPDSMRGGKFSSIFDNMTEIVIRGTSKKPYDFPYTSVRLKKNYLLYDFLNNINSWESFSQEDPISEYAMRAVYFYRGDEPLGGIWSHYVDYGNNFGWLGPNR